MGQFDQTKVFHRRRGVSVFHASRFPGLSSYARTVAETCPKQFNQLVELLEKGAANATIERVLNPTIEPAVWREWRIAVLALWQSDANALAPYAKDHMRQALWNLFERSYDEHDFKTASTCLDKLCKLDGLYEAQKVEQVINDPSSIADAKARLVELLQNVKVQSGLIPALDDSRRN
jgi:hypothetical protein